MCELIGEPCVAIYKLQGPARKGARQDFNSI
jgi:hypothetical protein